MTKALHFLWILFFCFNGSGQTVEFTGRVYFDNNGNHVFDSGDSAYKQAELSFYGSNTYHSAIAGNGGLYDILLPLDDYYISVSYLYNTSIYSTIESVSKDYLDAASDTIDLIDFAIQKRKNIEQGHVSMQNTQGGIEIPAASSTQSYRITFFYSGAIQQLPGLITLDYNPFVSFLSSTPGPSKQSSGHLEWQIPNIISENYFDSIGLSFHYPAMGDTIERFHFKTNFKPQVADPDTVFTTGMNQYIQHPYSTPIGPTNGAKWTRTFSAEGDTHPEYYGNSIDTALGGESYFVAGEKYSEASGSSFVAKLNKDGLSIWETFLKKFIDSTDGIYGSTVIHTKDGGCVVTGIIYSTSGTDYTSDIVIVKLDSNGKLQWKTRMAGSKEEAYNSGIIDIKELPGGGYLLVGDTKSNDGDFTNSNPDTLHSNTFVTRLSVTGGIVWTRVYGGSLDDEAFRILPLQNGTFLVLAATSSNDGDVTQPYHDAIEYIEGVDTVYNPEAWLLNIDANGNVIWKKCYGGTSTSYLAGAEENNGGILLTGVTNSKDGDLPYYDAKGAPLWILQISMTGQILWDKIVPQYKGYNTVADSTDTEFGDFGFFISNLRKKKDGSFIAGGYLADKYGELKARHGGEDMILVNISSAGNIIWQKAIGGANDDEIGDIQLDKNDDVVFVGNTWSDNDDFYEHVDGGSLMAVGKIGITNIIKGHVFIDNNGNHIKDASERYCNEGRIYSTKRTDTTIARIFAGQFLNNVDTGTYVTGYQPALDYFTISPPNKSSVFTTFDQKDSIDFALVPKPGIKDLQVSITAQTPARPGFNAGFRIITKNVGTTTIPATIVKLKKPSTLTYFDATRATSSITADTIAFAAISMPAGAVDTLDLILKLAAPPALNNGDTLTLTAIAFPQATDTTPSNNQATIREIVRGSFDPNDKTEAHAGIYTPTMKASGEPFQYLIRFQNTGTDTAFYVTVKDTLDSRVDINSLETISSSHAYKLSIDGNVATWQFNMIKLVDSTTDEAASHGYISFSIKPKDVLKVGDSVSNKAAIYFDFNLPVITNNSKLLLVSDQSVICPGGSTQLPAGYAGVAYQWQVNTGNGFANLANGADYSGVTTNALLLSNIPSSYYGYQYRCVITMAGNSKINSNIYKLTFASNWTGAVSTAWENTANWSCGSVPDANTDVVIKSTAIRQPEITTISAVCRSINATNASHVWVKAGAKLDVKGK